MTRGRTANAQPLPPPPVANPPSTENRPWCAEGVDFVLEHLTSALGSMTVPRGKRCSPWRSRTPRAASLSGLKPQISSSSAGSHCEEKSLWTVKVGSLSSEFWDAFPNLGERVCGQGQFTQLASLFFLLFFFAWREQKLPRITDKHLSTILGRF